MGITRSVGSVIWASLLAAWVPQLLGCAAEPTVAAEAAQIPPVPAGLARVWVLRQFEPGLGVQWSPMTYVNGSPLGGAYAGTVFYRDLAPGTYTLPWTAAPATSTRHRLSSSLPVCKPIWRFRC